MGNGLTKLLIGGFNRGKVEGLNYVVERLRDEISLISDFIHGELSWDNYLAIKAR